MRKASLVTGFIGVLLCAGCDSWKEGTRVSLTSTSPDRRIRVEIVEITGRFDRNFFLRVSDLETGTTTNVFYSPDEGGPGTERIVWSGDSSRLLLLGREFSVEERGRMPDGEQVYLLYDTKSGNLKCNATQQHRYGGFTHAELEAIHWTDKIEQDGPANGSQPLRSETNRTSPAAGSRR
jgi:hypothetical protein